MTRRCVTTVLLLLIVAVNVRAQFYDYYQDFKPFLDLFNNNRQDNRYYDVTTKKPKIVTTTRRPQFSWNFYEPTRNDNSRETSKEKQHRRKQTTRSPTFDFNLFTTTTIKPIRKTTKSSYTNRYSSTYNPIESSRPNKSKANSRITNNTYSRQSDYNRNSDTDGKIYFEDELNNIGDRYISNPIKPKPDYEVNQPVFNNYDNNYNGPKVVNDNFYTTKNPYNRVEEQPPLIENGPPITNKPPTGPGYHTGARPNNVGSISQEGSVPKLVKGIDEDDMSYAEKARYIDMAERMCDKYKKLNTKKVQAIPLIPSPQPVEVSVGTCAPINIPLVVGGKVVTIEEFPHMALLGWIKLEGGGYSWKCGGSLVSDQYVLTAAHCAYEERDNTVVTGSPRAVQLGSSYLDDPGALVVKVSLLVRHPKYQKPRSYYDIALVKLAIPVSFSDVVKPACLGVPPSAGEPVIATGWGQTEYGGEQSVDLRSVSIPIWDQYRCSEALGTSRKLPNGPESDNQVCAGDPRGGKDTCQGDSGGPAQLQDGCVWRIVAVTSLGRSCGAPNTPGLYAIVQRAFIAATVFGHKTNKNNNQDNRNNNYSNNNNNQNNNNDFRITTLDRTDSNVQPSANRRNDNNYAINDYNRNNNQPYNYNNNTPQNSQSNSNQESNNNYNRNIEQQINYNNNRKTDDNSYNYNSQQYYGRQRSYDYENNDGRDKDNQSYNTRSPSAAWWV